MPRRLPPGCVEDRDRYANFRIYYRRKGFRKVRLHGTPWTPEFMAQYAAAKKIAAPAKQGVLARPVLPNTWLWLCLRYFADCTEYKLLDPRTQHVRRQILEATFDELIRPDSDKRFAAAGIQVGRREAICADQSGARGSLSQVRFGGFSHLDLG